MGQKTKEKGKAANRESEKSIYLNPTEERGEQPEPRRGKGCYGFPQQGGEKDRLGTALRHKGL